ncbi:hypothetical protein AJ79_02101 [Helicocarpus griseus UAMH5409]|uniref:Fe2OG dioxygenase domain-containing protein n=1 Tax=Helicocarpus griseus UAMH5409 TaxID=1447875 RepID=A0A2B7XVY4_9EURO|nr:hypothetical protein AJ79_02101 [Helicocarpus griseus UAMH5409]
MAATLPIIDLRNYRTAEDLAPELMRVGKDPGFFYLIGHELTDDVAKQIFDLAEIFFRKTSKEEKMKFTGRGVGYTGLGDESLAGRGAGDLKESFYLVPHPDTGVGQSLPAILEAAKANISSFCGKCEALTDRLLEALAVGKVGLPRDYLSKHHRGGESRLRIIHYPEIEKSRQETSERDEGDIRAGAHTDYGSITLLFRQSSSQDPGGLQVLLNDKWVDIPCIKDTIVVNIADALEFLTSGRLRSTIHRVVSSDRERLSMPFFVQPDRDVLMAPISGEEVDKEEFNEVLKRKGYSSSSALTAEEHLMQRRNATYGY